MDYRYILRRALEITVRHKRLWLLGLLVSLSMLTRVNWRGLLEWLPASLYRPLYELFYGRYTAFFTALFFALMLLTGLGVAVLSALGRGALAAQTNHVENGGAPSARRGLEIGWRRLWPVFSILLLLGLPVLAIRLLGFVPYITRAYVLYLPPGRAIPADVVQQAAGRLLLCLLPAFVLSLPLEVPVRIAQHLGVRACILEGCSVRESLRRAWQLGRAHAAPLLLLWLALTAIEAAVLVVGLGLVALPSLAISLGLYLVQGGRVPLADSLYGAVLLGWLGMSALNSITATFLAAAWTLAYRDLTGLGRRGDESDWSAA